MPCSATARLIAKAKAPKRTVIEASTLTLDDKTAFKDILKKAGHIALDCPMSGTGAQAAVKDLVVYASGDTAAIRRLEPAFLGFARKVYDLGAYGNGSKMKFIANHLVAIHNVAAAEAMVLAMKAGLDPHQTVEVIGSGAGTSRDVRAARADDGRQHLPAGHHALDDVEEGFDGDRRLRLRSRLSHAAVRSRHHAAYGHSSRRPRRRG